MKRGKQCEMCEAEDIIIIHVTKQTKTASGKRVQKTMYLCLSCLLKLEKNKEKE